MRDIERVLAEIGTEIRNDLRHDGEPQPRRFGHVMRKARRRRALRASAGPLLAGGVALGLFALPITLPFQRPPTPAKGVSPVVSAADDPAPDGIGFWPKVSEHESAELCESLTGMKWHDMAAAGFVGEALGWSNTAERDVRRIGKDLIVKQQGNFPSTFIGGGTPDSPWITLKLSRLGNGRCWWVTGVSDPDDDASLSVTVGGGSLAARWDMAPDATRADLLVVDSNGRRLIPGDEGATSASEEGFEGPGFALLLWRGVEGSVVSAAGVTLPEEDHSSTSP